LRGAAVKRVQGSAIRDEEQRTRDWVSHGSDAIEDSWSARRLRPSPRPLNPHR
jgi:hypothetical protein